MAKLRENSSVFVTGQFLGDWVSSSKPYRTYLRKVLTRSSQITVYEICGLCGKCMKAEQVTNIKRHFENSNCEEHQAAVDTARSELQTKRIDVALQDVLKTASISKTTRSFQDARNELNAMNTAHTYLVRDMIVKLCASHLLPYSFVDWPEFRQLCQVLLMLPPTQLPSLSRSTLQTDLDKSAARMTQSIASELASAILTFGEGCLALQLDGVQTRRGERVPLLLSFISPADWKRKIVVVDLMITQGKSARVIANEVYEAFSSLGLEKALLESSQDLKIDFPARGHFLYNLHDVELPTPKEDFDTPAGLDNFVEELNNATAAEKRLRDESAGEDRDEECPEKFRGSQLLRILKYAIGSSTTDGALTSFFSNLLNSPGATTHHCDAHKCSLAAKFGFALKTHRLIASLPSCELAAVQSYTTILSNLVIFYAPSVMHDKLVDFCGNAPHLASQKILRTHVPSETRFLSYVDTCKAIYHNIEFYRYVYGNAGSVPVPDEVSKFFTKQTVLKDNKAISYVPANTLMEMMPVIDRVEQLIKMAESNDGDPYLFQLEIGKLLTQLDGRFPFRGSIAAAKLNDNTVIKSIMESLKYAFAFYFDRPLLHDWCVLLAMVLHPGFAESKSGDTWHETPPPCLIDRFKHCWDKKSSTWVQVDVEDMLHQTLVNCEKILHEELSLQWDIDHCGPFQSAHANAPEGPATISAPAMSSAATPATFEADDEDDYLQFTMRNAIPRVPQPVNKRSQRNAHVLEQLSKWLSDENFAYHIDKTDYRGTTLDFWTRQPDCPLRRIAMRALSMTLSQCETERVNKIPKAVWTDERMNITAQHGRRDVVLYANRDRIPEHKFNYKTLQMTYKPRYPDLSTDPDQDPSLNIAETVLS